MPVGRNGPPGVRRDPRRKNGTAGQAGQQERHKGDDGAVVRGGWVGVIHLRHTGGAGPRNRNGGRACDDGRLGVHHRHGQGTTPGVGRGIGGLKHHFADAHWEIGAAGRAGDAHRGATCGWAVVREGRVGICHRCATQPLGRRQGEVRWAVQGRWLGVVHRDAESAGSIVARHIGGPPLHGVDALGKDGHTVAAGGGGRAAAADPNGLPGGQSAVVRGRGRGVGRLGRA